MLAKRYIGRSAFVLLLLLLYLALKKTLLRVSYRLYKVVNQVNVH
jgi:hypothetical protein